MKPFWIMMVMLYLFIILVAATQARADPRCRQLELLHVQYAGVTLSPAQRALKRTLVAWYNRNCRRGT